MIDSNKVCSSTRKNLL